MKKAADAARHALGEKPKAARKGKGRITHTHIEHTVNGGHVVRHEYANQGEQPSPDQAAAAGPYALANMQQLHDHLDQQVGGSDGGEEEAAPAPAQ